MKEFLSAALPFVIIGVCLAMIHANAHKQGNSKNYLAVGICLGICMGGAAAAVFHIRMGLSISLGMLIGETAGMLMKKKS